MGGRETPEDRAKGSLSIVIHKLHLCWLRCIGIYPVAAQVYHAAKKEENLSSECLL
jgi:hypothetical protein